MKMDNRSLLINFKDQLANSLLFRKLPQQAHPVSQLARSLNSPDDGETWCPATRSSSSPVCRSLSFRSVLPPKSSAPKRFAAPAGWGGFAALAVRPARAQVGQLGAVQPQDHAGRRLQGAEVPQVRPDLPRSLRLPIQPSIRPARLDSHPHR